MVVVVHQGARSSIGQAVNASSTVHLGAREKHNVTLSNTPEGGILK